ncbi:MAG TPA: fumarylacetoacetate hydrolase family protein [Sphingobium sp.]
MRLVTIDDVPGGSPGAQLASGEVLHLLRAARPSTLEAWLPRSITGILEGGKPALSLVRDIVSRAEQGEGIVELKNAGAILDGGTPLLAPIPAPRLLLAVGLAYRSHLAEMAGTPAPEHPTAFMKSPSSVAAPGHSLTLPPAANDMVDFEGELACVFGRPCHNVTPADAMDHIAGYMAANDISARNWAPAVWAASDPWKARLTWEVNIMGKQFPGFTPLGPVLTTVDDIPDPSALRLVTRLNGQVMQDAQVSDMIFPLDEVISYFSRWYHFQPGDVLLTGTPAGVGIGRKPPIFLTPGDRVEVEIDRIGTLSTPIRAI